MLLIKTPSLIAFFSLFFGVLAFAPSCPAQIAGGMNETTVTHLGGNNFLAGTVFGPNGTPISVRMGIRLSAQTGGDFLSSTDDRGQFVFSGLAAGYYTITIDGERDFEAVSQQVEVIQTRSAGRQTYTISIRLVEKIKRGSKPAVVNQADLGIPKHAAELYRKSIDRSKNSDHKGAVEQLTLAIAEYPPFFDAYNELGVQYMQLGDLEKAADALKEAIKIRPNGFEALVNRGIVLFRLKNYTEAETSLRAAITVKDQSAIAHYYLGRTLINLTQYDGAEKELNLAIRLGGDDMKEGHRMLANLFIAKGDDQKAVKEIEVYLTLAPDAPDADKLRTAIGQLKGQKHPSPKQP